MERAPSQVLLRDVSRLAGLPSAEPTRLRRAAADVAAFVGAHGDDLVFVDNATTGVNAVLRSFRLEPDDEILLTDHAYGATARIGTFVARERRAQVRVVQVPYPRFDADQLIDAVTQAIGPRTRIAVLDHVSSESALVLPLHALAARCRARGVAVLVDAAHAPGMLPLDVPSLGVDWYVANLHKWAHAPRSCGFLWADPSRQADLHPPVISWGLDQGFLGRVRLGRHARSLGLAGGAGWPRVPRGNSTSPPCRGYNHDSRGTPRNHSRRGGTSSCRRPSLTSASW